MENTILLSFYYAEWEPSSLAMLNVFNRVKESLGNKIQFESIDLKERKGGNMCFEMIPAFVFTVNEKEVYRHIGMLTEENLHSYINSYLLDKELIP